MCISLLTVKMMRHPNYITLHTVKFVSICCWSTDTALLNLDLDDNIWFHYAFILHHKWMSGWCSPTFGYVTNWTLLIVFLFYPECRNGLKINEIYSSVIVFVVLYIYSNWNCLHHPDGICTCFSFKEILFLR